MSFISLKFILFLAVVTTAWWLLPVRLRPALLLTANLMFYWLAGPQFLPWLLLSVAVAWGAGMCAASLKSENARKFARAAGVTLLLGMLAYFKYFGFFTVNLSALLGRELALSGAAALAAPVGISFYTFTCVGYVLDVGRGERCERNPLIFAAYVTFFPHILSGPIARSTRLLPQLTERRSFDRDCLVSGARRFALGVFRKAVIADSVGYFVDAVYYHYDTKNPACLVAAVLLYGIQLYFDFAGYTDMALGAARLLGLAPDENFDAPYFSQSVDEIWKRWHMTLTNWLRDYLYIPLGGSRRGFARKLLNIAIVFIVSGLWHGAEWGFVVWGAIFAALRLAGELIKRRAGIKRFENSKGVLGLLRMGGVYVVWCSAFAFFRLEKLPVALTVFSRILKLGEWSLFELRSYMYDVMMSIIPGATALAKIWLLCVAVSASVILLLEYLYIYRRPKGAPLNGDLLSRLRPAPRFAMELWMLCVSLAFGAFGQSSFIYYQF